MRVTSIALSPGRETAIAYIHYLVKYVWISVETLEHSAV